ncbi:MAG: hypothetical protein J6K03_07185 [Oscillospiraceae bacterium]|nr:hypothetical protein [Oscillospiraceae bacterium]
MQTINLNINKKTVIPVLCAKQGDVGRKFQVVFSDGIPESVAFSVWYSGASGEGNYTHIGDVSAFTIDGNTVTVELITQMLTNAGEGLLCLVMSSADGAQLASWNIPYMVESVPGMGSAVAEQYYTAFSELKHLPVVANAEPGQTITVKEVDENGKPILWETVTPIGESGEGINSAVFNGNNPETATGESAAVVGATYEYLDGVRIQMPKASGKASTVSGMGCQATGNAADASGILTKATAPAASARGNNTIASGYGSSAEGGSTIAASTYQHVQGTFNEPDEEGKYAHIVGGGTKLQRKNVHTLDWDGNAWFLGRVLAAALNLCGDECTVGVKGFYWQDIVFVDEPDLYGYKITLSTINGDHGTEQEFDITAFWGVGDVISIHNNQKHYDCAQILKVEANAIYVGDVLPFDTVNDLNPQSDHFTDNAVYVLSKPQAGLVDFGPYANAAGLLSKALNYCATAFGANVEVLGQYGFGAGRDHKIGHAAAAFGRENTVMGEQAFGAGAFNTVLGNLAVAFGRNNTVSGRGALVAGLENKVTGEGASCLGTPYTYKSGAKKINEANGKAASVRGMGNVANGDAAEASGILCSAYATGASAKGNGTNSSGYCASAEGQGTKAASSYQHVQGKFNKVDSTDQYAHIVGGGSSDTDRKNIHTLDWSGNAMFAGTVEGTALILKSPNGTRFQIAVDDDGILTTTAI